MASVRTGSRATRLTNIGLILIVVGIVIGASTIAQYAADNVALALSIVLWVLSGIAVVGGVVLVVVARSQRRATDMPPPSDAQPTELPRGGDPLSRLPLDDVDPDQPSTRSPRDPHTRPE